MRVEIGAYLRRHGDPNSDFDAADLVASELITNGLSHVEGKVWISVNWSEPRPLLRVVDLGDGFELDPHLPSDPAAVGGRGLYIVSRLAADLAARRRRAGGMEVTATLPVTRRESVTVDPPRRKTSVLPGLDEALPGGGFGRESFLRALVVQLAQTVAASHGPDAAEAAVAQVGVDIGGQMEREYRAATGAVGPLSTAQLGECLVRLKRAIEGDFAVVEMTDTKIVLENTRCPFQEAVTNAPALCRMTSAVFGGIAAGSAGRAAEVILEERIALGDARCRVVVDLDPPATRSSPWAHRYLPPV